MTLPSIPKKYLIIGFLAIIIGGVIVTTVIVGRSFLSKASSPTPTPAPQIIRIPAPAPQNIASPTAVPKEIPVPTQEPNAPITSNGWIVTGSNFITIVPQFSLDKKSLTVDFQNSNYSRINNIEYSLTYTADPQVIQLIKDNFVPLSATTRKSIPLGTCSGTNCVYDTNPRGFTLRVLVKSNNSLNINLVTLTYAASP